MLFIVYPSKRQKLILSTLKMQTDEQTHGPTTVGIILQKTIVAKRE